ncbi:unnamed protein product [Anisakis simplex]|uniref:Uncharacterized protein n=2 Tax=Anisakis simplex TaxID=6269 RepID=A0A3P6PT58_ANISI|nr:unnamed protein product [Anisakis simplex]
MFALIEPLVRIMFHDALRKRFKHIFSCCLGRSRMESNADGSNGPRGHVIFADNRINPAIVRLYDSKGRLMTFSAAEERNLYFQNLSNSWK